MPRTALALGALLALALGLTACVAEPEPEPEWTEDTAYAEAEEVFRAYIAASDFESDEDESIYVTGDLLEAHNGDDPFEGYDIQTRGESVITRFTPTSFRTVGSEVSVDAVACFDDSDFEMNIDGAGWLHPRENPIYGVELSFASVNSEVLLSDLDETGEVTC